MSQYLSVNPLSLTNDELTNLISHLNRIKAQRTVLSAVSVLNEIAMKEKTTVKYVFNRCSVGWTVVASIDINGSLRVGCVTDRTKSVAKEKAAGAVRNQVVYDRSYKKFTKGEVSHLNQDTKDFKEYERGNENNYSEDDYSNNEYCPEDCECHYSEDGYEYDEEDERIGDCSPNPSWFSEWKDMSNEQKRQYLDNELNEYISDRLLIKHKICKKFSKQRVLSVVDSTAMNMRYDITDYICSLPTGREQIHAIRTMEEYDRFLDKDDIFEKTKFIDVCRYLAKDVQVEPEEEWKQNVLNEYF